MGSRDAFSGSVRYFCDIGQVVVRCEEEDRQMNISRALAFRYDVVWGVVLMPAREPSSRRGLEGIIVYHVAGLRNDGFRETHDGLHVEESQIGRAVFEHAMTQSDVFRIDIQAIRVFQQAFVQVITHFGAPVRGQDIFKKKKALGMEGVYPRLDPGRIDCASGKVFVGY
jgi:hypothetical protein